MLRIAAFEYVLYKPVILPIVCLIRFGFNTVTSIHNLGMYNPHYSKGLFYIFFNSRGLRREINCRKTFFHMLEASVLTLTL